MLLKTGSGLRALQREEHTTCHDHEAVDINVTWALSSEPKLGTEFFLA